MTDEQWRAAWVLCETAADLDGEAQRDYVRGATVDAEVERRVNAVFEELESEPFYPPTPDRHLGLTVGRYTLTGRIGQGGMGEVYAAEDAELRRTVALKFLPTAVAPDKAAASHVISEARLASRLNHPNIVTVYELIQTPWGLAMVMELVEGQSLRAVRKTRRLSRHEIIRIGRQIASALAAAHQKGIVHRDIKPENIMVRADGYVKVLDFGLAQNIRDQTIEGVSAHLPVGTVRYMSPEQKLGGIVTGASDIYSCGIVLEELGTWRHPLLARMRNAAAERRPSAEEVASTLERVEASTNRHLLLLQWAIACAVLALFVGVLARVIPFRHSALTSVATESSDFHISPLASLPGAERQPSISPDGTRVAVAYAETATSNTRIVVKKLSDPNIVRVTSGQRPELRPVFSPDGTKLAFVRELNGRLEIVVVPAQGGAERRVAEIADLRREYSILTWDASGENIVVCDRPTDSQPTVALFKISVTTGARRQITFPPAGMSDWMPHVSPDGSALGFARVFETGRGDIWTVSNNQPPHRLTTSGDVFYSWAWYRDGREVLVTYRRSGRTLLWRQAAAGGEQRRVAGLEKEIREFSVSRSGTALVFGSGTEDFNVWWYPFPPSKRPPRPLIASAGFDGDAHYSPDGKKIVFSSTRSGQSNIWICSSDGSDLRQVTMLDTAGFTTGSPNWSPDGRWLAFDSRAPKTESSIFLIDPAGKQTRRLTGPGPSDIIPSWSRDSQWVYFASDREPPEMQIWKVPVTGGPAVRVTRHGGYEAFESADGSFLYFTKKGQKTSFWRMPLSGGEEAPVAGLEDIGNRYWDGSREGIYFVARLPRPALRLFSFSTHQIRTIRNLLVEPAPAFHGLSIAPNHASFLYLHPDIATSHLEIVNNFHLRD